MWKKLVAMVWSCLNLILFTYSRHSDNFLICIKDKNFPKDYCLLPRQKISPISRKTSFSHTLKFLQNIHGLPTTILTTFLSLSKAKIFTFVLDQPPSSFSLFPSSLILNKTNKPTLLKTHTC